MSDEMEEKITLSDGNPVTSDHREINPETGQQKGYVVLSEEEREKGFVRPVRYSYRHVGKRPQYQTRGLTAEEQVQYAKEGYFVYEEYPPSEHPKTGRFWTREELESGCNTVTKMGKSIAETYARDPKFYSGTFCVQCKKHFPVDEFVWEGTDIIVGQ